MRTILQLFGKKQKENYIISKIKLISYRSSHDKNSKTITKLLVAKLVGFGNDGGRYHGDDLEGTSIARLFQNLEKSLKQLLIKRDKIITNETQKKK